MKNIKSIIAGILLSLVVASPAIAEECHTVYGGGEVCETCNINVDKEIWNPSENGYWDNIDSSDYTFESGEEVKFKIVVKNTSDINVNNIEIKDYLPEYVDYVSTYISEDNHEYEWKSPERYVLYFMGSLDPDQSKTAYLTIRVKDEEDIPVGTTTLTNKVRAYSEDECSDTNYANFAISREGKGTVLGVTSPDTGNNGLILTLELIGFVGMAGAYGMVLRKHK
jgi:uncharacterized repeat protein (TIGR01451 family)